MTDTYALTCPCDCHGKGQFGDCSVDGGCGYLHRPEPNLQAAAKLSGPADARVLHKTRDEVRQSLRELCDPIRWGISNHFAPSLLNQLRDAVATGTERGSRGKGVGLPIAVDAHDLLVEIGQRTIWLVQQSGVSPAGAAIEPNLREVVAACGLSMDVESIVGVRGFLRSWVTQIRTLFDPPQKWALWSHACPECDAKTAQRVDDSDGEEKQTAALEVVFTGTDQDRKIRIVHCLACEEEWQPNQLLFLGRLLGCEIPGIDHENEGEPAA